MSDPVPQSVELTEAPTISPINQSIDDASGELMQTGSNELMYTQSQQVNQPINDDESTDQYESILLKTDSKRLPPINRSINQRSQSFMSHSENVNTVLTWQNLSISAARNGSINQLIDNVSGCIAGGLWAVMGPSGSGKSTLLNALACRLDGNVTINGELRLNGRPYSNTELKKISGYVMQDDLLNPHLTVRETLHYAAQLRLPRTFTSAEREQRIDEVIREMGLSHARDVLVGDPSRKGISGGERRRVCIGCELLTRPQLLFMDEPTSGLDSVTAYSLVRRLKRITRTGKCCMIITIHQPQARLFSLFDRLLLLKSGKILFSGSIPNALELFAECGFPVPRHSNPADHILDTITPPMDATFVNALAAADEKDPATADLEKGESKDVVTFSYKEENEVKLREQYEKTTKNKIDLGYGSEKPLLLDRDQIPWLTQVKVLFHRNIREAKRKKLPIIFAVAQTIIMGLLVGASFYNIGTGQSSTIRRSPACFFFCVNQGVVGGLMIINSFPAERALMLRERAAGSYFVSAYFVAKTLVDSLTTLPVPLLFGLICYWMIGFQPEGSKFIIYLILLCLCNFAATSLALMISAACKTTDFSVTVLPMALEVSRLFGGFYLAPGSLPKYFSWLDALSYLKYSYVGISLNELEGLELSCQPSELRNGVCPIPNGQVTIDNLGLDYINIGGCVGALIAYIMFCQTVAYLCIRYNKSP